MGKTDDLRLRYEAALHAMQSGVAMQMHHDGGPEGNGETSPKHLRVGVNSAMIDGAALARLLIEKGVITEIEYYEQLVVLAEEEQRRYEAILSERFGREIKLA